MYGMRYLTNKLSPSRFNRRLHALAAWLRLLLETRGAILTHGQGFLSDRLPVPVCRRARPRRCRQARGAAYCGYCAAKREKFFGWRLHLVGTVDGVPMAFDLLPTSLHDLTSVHELTVGLAAGAGVYGDKVFNCAKDEASIRAATGVRLVPVHKANMPPKR